MDNEHIRPIVICLFRRGDRLLVAQDYDSIKQDYFCRPLGGGIKFGEQSRVAMLREIAEELAAEVDNLRLVGVLENIFTYEGRAGHEIVFVYDAEFVNKSLYEQAEICCFEPEANVKFVARWASPVELERQGIRLVPETLSLLLAK
jgi:8-oxo-dGTP pyrophosphatase MutT (NUDIX family)